MGGWEGGPEKILIVCYDAIFLQYLSVEVEWSVEVRGVLEFFRFGLVG